MRIIGMLGVVLCAVLVWATQVQAEATTNWVEVAFQGQNITLVRVNENDPNNVAVVANNNFNITRDGGITWQEEEVGSIVREVVFDSALPGVMYAGTDHGVYVRSQFGRWRLFDDQVTPNKAASGMAFDGANLYAVLSNGAGTEAGLYRFNRQGNPTSLMYPGGRAVSLDFDIGRSQLFLTTANGLMASKDQGLTWQMLNPNGHGAGQVKVKDGVIWESTADGLYRSTDYGTSWDHLGFAGQVDGLNYGSDVRIISLAITRGVAIFGDWGPFTNLKFLTVYEGGSAHSIREMKANSVAANGSSVWVASDQGLWHSASFGVRPRISRPLVIIPGILGSMPVPSVWGRSLPSYIQPPTGALYYHTDLILDPIAHTYDPLIEQLQNLGYQKGINLFAFLYNWRQDNRESGHQLELMLADVRHACGCQQVDIVAHSMGGLVARSYIEGNSYQNDIANLITVGTPNAGSPEAYPIWEAGDLGNGIDLVSAVERTVFEAEALSHGHLSLVDYIRSDVPSVSQLFPVYSYIHDREYPQGYPQNDFLKELNMPGAISLMRQRPAYYNIGSSDHDTTIAYNVSAEKLDQELWPHGRILSEAKGEGDGTVPLASLEKIGPRSLVLEGDHGEIMAQTGLIRFLHRILMGEFIPVEKAIAYQASRYLIISSATAGVLSVNDQAGQGISQYQLTIPQAYYSGDNSSPTLMVVPIEHPGRYHIVFTGTQPNERLTIRYIDQQTQANFEQTLAGPKQNGNSIEADFDSQRQSLTSNLMTQIDVNNTSLLSSKAPVSPSQSMSTSLNQQIASSTYGLMDADKFSVSTQPLRQKISPAPMRVSAHHGQGRVRVITLVCLLLCAVMIAMWIVRGSE